MNKYFIKACVIMVAIFISKSGFALEKFPVFVSIVPQKYFVQQIGKDRVDVQVMVQPGASPAIYEPRPSQMAALTKAKLYFSIGVPFENTWLKKIVKANPKMEVIHTDYGIKKIPIAAHYHHDEKDEGHEGIDGQSLDPHVWLSPKLVRVQIETILNALQKADPSHQAVYEANFKAFMARIADLDNELHSIFREKKQLRFMVFHPSWGYFAKSYGLRQVPIEIEGKNPKPAQLKELIKHARKNKINVIFVQPQFSTKSARLIAREIKGQIVFADPLAANWMANMQQVAQTFKEALK
ncbi:MAG: zinc ABC transporter solute-binding protein [Desulfobacteraceae bacterium]|nr:zinc ABC transporter solute-binding protein [Desulfobacteraceae bacterium]